MEQPLPILSNPPFPLSEAEAASATRKMELLEEELARRVVEGALVAFSGGLDSAFLLFVAHQAAERVGGRIMALTTTSPSTPEQDKNDALAFTQRLGVEHVWRESRETTLPEYARNDRERCYHCKTELFRIAGGVAAEHDLRWLLYGYNASDRQDDRPGHRAAEEVGALTPLAEVELTKPEIRHLMEERDLPLSRKSASPCLSSRIMTGIPITSERLQDVQAMEAILREAGVSTLRVRLCQEEGGSLFLRIETAPEEMEAVLRSREELFEEGRRRGYRWVTLDLGGYRTGGGVS